MSERYATVLEKLEKTVERITGKTADCIRASELRTDRSKNIRGARPVKTPAGYIYSIPLGNQYIY